MRTKIVRIGNSQGIRLPKLLLERSALSEDVELEVHDQQIIIRSAHPPRHGWNDAFKVMADRRDDKLLDHDQQVPTVWDGEEWEW